MKKGSIILVPFYFTDFTRYKLRPSLIVSYQQSNLDDYIVAFIFTIIPVRQLIHETHFIIDSNESFFYRISLKKASILKCDKLMTINQSIIAGLLGEILTDIIKIIDKKLKTAFLLQ